MPLTIPSPKELADFMNEEEKFLFSNEGYGAEALAQAVDFLVIASGTDVEPALPLDQRVVQRGICQMAEAIIRTLPERHMAASVIGKEQAGNYSYSLIKDKAIAGVPVGLQWFDLAVDKLQQLNNTSAGNSLSIEVFENRNIFTYADGSKHLLGPLDEGRFLYPYNAESRWW